MIKIKEKDITRTLQDGNKLHDVVCVVLDLYGKPKGGYSSIARDVAFRFSKYGFNRCQFDYDFALNEHLVYISKK